MAVVGVQACLLLFFLLSLKSVLVYLLNVAVKALLLPMGLRLATTLLRRFLSTRVYLNRMADKQYYLFAAIAYIILPTTF